MTARQPVDQDAVKRATIEKLQAEAEKARKETELAEQRAAGELRKLEAETEHQAAMASFINEQARGSRAIAAVQEIQADQAAESERERKANDKYNFIYKFNSEVSATSVTACMDQLTKWERLHPGQGIEIIFNSPGGGVIEGMALFDYLKALERKGHKITTVAYGYAASMAGILLQAGTTRAIGRESYILIHEVSFGVMGKIGEVEDEVDFIKKIQDRVLDIFAERSTMSRRAIKSRWTRKDWWLDSVEALESGFVDEVR